MNLHQLHYFTAVCTYQSVSKAAEHLHISQPSLSAAIMDLEKEFGVSLFTRHYRGVSLTKEGQIFYPLAKDILSRVEQAAGIMQDLGSGRKVLKLGVPPMIGSLILPRIYKNFTNGDIALEIIEGGYHDLLGKLADKELDLAFLPHTGPLDPVFSCIPAGDLEVCCCAKKGYFPLSGTVVGAAELEKHPLVLFENSFLQTELILNWFRAAGVKARVLLQTQQLSTMLQMLESGQAMGFLFRELVDIHPGLEVIPTQAPIFLHVSLAKLSGMQNSRAMDVFFQYLAENNPFET